MTTRLYAALAALLWLTACPADTSAPAAPPQKTYSGTPVKIGVLPATASDDVSADYEPVLLTMADALKRPTELVVAKNYDALIDALTKGEVHVAQLSAYLWVRVKPSVKASVVVQQRMAWDTEYRGAVVVAKGSKLKSIADLAGKKLAYVDQQSSAGYYYPRMKMRALGLDPDKHFGSTTFGGTHKKVAEMVEAGLVDAGVVSEQTLSEGLSLGVIERTDVIPDDAIVATDALSAAEKSALKLFFLGAHKEPRMTAFMTRRGIETFVSPNVSVYEPLEKEMGLLTDVTAPADAAAAKAPKAKK